MSESEHHATETNKGFALRNDRHACIGTFEFRRLMPLEDKRRLSALLCRAVNNHERLLETLRGLLNRYTELVDSGDCGFWDPEAEEVVVAARQAIEAAEASNV